ncbi:hybrid sensor histidine kinase/response regulator [Eleftheria terrae]|uniref:hybrid sensor histidine kinase/response regulator n=1 Tax=Eleftheria terrae TaxID=1597781 RepID=UPI00263BB204|nr:PAS domain-containing protein [Eleftheria terrae]WKB51868.1 PAS domain-containing protein [Eleftheria terrae]
MWSSPDSLASLRSWRAVLQWLRWSSTSPRGRLLTVLLSLVVLVLGGGWLWQGGTVYALQALVLLVPVVLLTLVLGAVGGLLAGGLAAALLFALSGASPAVANAGPPWLQAVLFTGFALLLSLLALALRAYVQRAQHLLAEDRVLREHERELRELNNRLELAAQAASFGVWEYDVARRHFMLDARVLALLGAAGPAREMSYEAVRALVHPEDRERLERRFEQVLAQESVYDVQFRVRLPEGGVRWLRSVGKVERDARGAACRVVGLDHDITRDAEARLSDLRAQEALRELNARLNVALSAVHASVWVYDAASGRLEWDERGDDLYGQPLNDRPGAWEASLAPDTAAATVQRWRAHLDDPQCDSFNLEYGVRHPARGLRHVRCVGRIERDGQGRPLRAIGLDLDVTEQRVTAQRAEELSNRLQLAISASGLGIWLLDLEAGRTEWNDELYRIYGEDPRHFQPTLNTWEERLHPDDLDRVRTAAARTLSGEPVDVDEYRILRPDGEVRTVRTRLRHVRNPAGRTLRVVGATLDITEQKQATQAIERARAAAEEANRLKSEFLANMSHEIRTPMNAIIGMTGLALLGELPPREQQHVAKANGAARNLLRVLNDILDFSKIEAGRLEVEATRFSLHEVLEQVVDVVGLQAAEKGLELVMDLPASLPAEHLGDPTRLAQVLTNLLANAVKFTAQGRVVLRAGVLAAVPGTAPRRLRFEVSDTGIGLDAAQQALLFQPFSQADNSTTRRFGGTGLGLVICRRLLELMGGQIGVQSRPGAGATFWFELPLTACEPGTPLGGPLPPARPQWVLVVDDDAATRAALVRLLQGMGHQAAGAAGAAEARQLWQAHRPQGLRRTVVLLDAGLPDGAALSLAAEFAREAPAPRVLLMCRPQEPDTLRQQSQRAGVHGWLSKPVLPAPLRVALGEASSDPATRPGHLSLPALRGMKVLLAEDNPLNRELAIELLQRAGVQVSTVGSGREAVEAVQHDSFDAVLMDVQMPEMDGFEATRRIRALGGPHAWLPIIAMTAHAMAGDRERSLAAGMDDHLAKPIDTALLLRTLQRWGGQQPEVDAATRPARWADTPARPGPPDAPPPVDGPSVLDAQAALRGCGGSPAILRRALQRFVELYAEPPLQAGDPPETAARAAHSLKGVAGSLGMQALQERARHAELSSRGGQALPPATRERLNAAVAAARAAALAWLQQPPER